MGHLFLMEREFQDSPSRGRRAADGPHRVEQREGWRCAASPRSPPPGSAAGAPVRRAPEGVTRWESSAQTQRDPGWSLAGMGTSEPQCPLLNSKEGGALRKSRGPSEASEGVIEGMTHNHWGANTRWAPTGLPAITAVPRLQPHPAGSTPGPGGPARGQARAPLSLSSLAGAPSPQEPPGGFEAHSLKNTAWGGREPRGQEPPGHRRGWQLAWRGHRWAELWRPGGGSVDGTRAPEGSIPPGPACSPRQGAPKEGSSGHRIAARMATCAPTRPSTEPGCPPGASPQAQGVSDRHSSRDTGQARSPPSRSHHLLGRRMAPEHGLSTSRGWQHPGGSSGTRCDLGTQVLSVLPRGAPRSPEEPRRAGPKPAGRPTGAG